MGSVVYLADRQPRRRGDHAERHAGDEDRCAYDPVWETWRPIAPDPVAICRARSHRSIREFENSARDNRELPRFVGKLKGDAGRDPLNSLCQFGAVCAATQAAVIAMSVTAITCMAFVPFHQFQTWLRHAASLPAPHRMELGSNEKFPRQSENVPGTESRRDPR